ncbi:YadA-like family protein [Gallibacterium anatis]|uniref:YadA-like family protein n=1 Tax=Gallibacterium anatis TaxID=750 RepID=UPI00080272FD|nr:YadA-like family protein [Gallibacterium anatis]OBW92686.1 hypothetical protein QV02_10020 [Gallibacterium anatis]
MNKIYKTKYSVAKKEIVVVSELTASHGKETSSVGQNNKKLNFSAKLSVISSAMLTVGLLLPSFVSAQNLIMNNGSVYAQNNSDFDGHSFRKFIALNPAGSNGTSNPGVVGEYAVVIGNEATGGSKDNDRTTVIGYKSKAIAGEATVVGATSGAGSQAVAVGANVYAQGYSSIAIGSDDPMDMSVDKVGEKYGVKFPKDTLISIYQDLWAGTDNNKKFFTDQNEFLRSYWDEDPNSTTSNKKAVWSPTYAKKLGAIAIGTRTIAGGEVSTSIGTLSFALADRSTAMGIKAYVDTLATGGTAIGENSRIFAPNSVAIGNKTEATSQGAMAYGYQAYAVGKNSIAIGSQVAASAKFYTANTASLSGTYDKLSQKMTSLNGNDASINTAAYEEFDATFETLHGSGMPLWKDNSKTYLSIGNENIQKTLINSSDSENSIVIGGRSYAVKKNSLAVGYSTLADADNSFAIGSYTYVKSSSKNSIGIGVGAYVDGMDSFLAGTQSRTASERTVVLGPFSKIGSGSGRSMTFGYLSEIGNQSYESIALGALSKISNNVSDSIAFGTLSKIDAAPSTNAENNGSISNALAIGKDATVKKGVNTKETGNNAMALGVGALAMLENSVALGVGSRTDYKYADLMKDPWVAKGATSVPTSGKTGVISVGSTGAERRITNVASGRLDTDAVNVAQLKTIDEKFDIAIESLNNGGGVKYLSIEHINSKGEAGQINAKIKLGENYIKYVNLLKTLKSIDARKKLNNDSFNEESVNKLKETLEQLQKESVNAGLVGGYENIATDLKAITIPDTGNYQEVLDKIAAAAETDSKRSVNNLTPEEIAKLKQGNNYLNDGAAGIDSIAFGFGAKTSGGHEGDDGKHAVAIGYEAEANGENAIAIGNLAKALANNALSIGNGNEVRGANSGALGDPNYVSGTGTYVVGNDNGTSTTPIAATNSGFFGNGNQSSAVDGVRIIGNSNTISASNVMVFGNNIIASVANSVYLGSGSSVSDVKADTTAGKDAYNKYTGSVASINSLFDGYAFAGTTPNGFVSVGAVGKERRIQNVAAGLISVTSTDAINGSQLYATNDLLGKLATTKIKFTGNKNSTTETQLYSPTAPLNFDIKGDENDLTSEASGKAISFSLLKETSIEDKKDSLKTATTKAIYDAIVGAKTTVSHTPNSPYLTVTPTVGTGLTANAYSVAFNYDALKRDLTGELPFAKSDASNLSSDNITAWKNTLGLNNLSPNIGYRAGESTERKTVQASTGLTFVSEDPTKLVIKAEEKGVVKFESKGVTASELDNKLSGLSSTLKIAGDTSVNGPSVDLKTQELGVKGTSGEIVTKAEGQNISVSLDQAVIYKIDGKLDKSDFTNDKISEKLTKGSVVTSDTVSITGTGANRLLGDGNLSFEVKNGSINSDKLANNAVTSDKIENGAITANKLGNDIKLKYTANNEKPKEINLTESLKFTDSDNTTASVEDNGVVKYSVKTAELTHDATKGVSVKDGNSETSFATAGNVAEMFKKTSESLANKGLDFTGSLSSNGLKIHRNLGDEVKIIGAKDTNEGLGQITDYSAKNLATLVDATSGTIQIAIKKTPEFEGILLKGQDGTNGKDGFIGVDKDGNVIVKNGIDGKNGADTTGSKVVTEDSLNATAKLAYKANSQGYNGQENPSVSLTQGLNFTNGSNTTAEIAADGVVKYSVNTATLENNSTTGEVSVKNTDNGTNFATAENIATAINEASKGVVNKGLKFKGDDNQTITKALGSELTIKGGKTKLTELTGENIGVVSEGESLVVKLAKDLKDLGSISTDTLLAKTSVKVPSIVLGLEDEAPTLTGSLSEGKKLITINDARITGLEKGISDKDAVNYSQLSPIAKAIGATIDQSGSVTGPTFDKPINGSQTAPNSIKDAIDQIAGNLSKGWIVQDNAAQDVASINASDKVKFDNGTGTTSSVIKSTSDDGIDTTTVKFDIVKSDLTFNETGGAQAAQKGDAFATASDVADVINKAFAKASENVASGYADINLSNITNAGKNVVTSLVTANGNDDISVKTTGGENGVAKNFAVSLNKVKEVTNSEEKVVTSGAVYTAITGAKTTVNASTDSSSKDYLTVSGNKTNDLDGNTFTVGLTKRATDALKVIEAALTPVDKDRTTPDGLLNSDLSNISDKGKETVKDLAIEAIDVTAKEGSGLSVSSNTNTDETHKKTFTIDLAKATLSKKDDGTVEVDNKGNTFATAENVANTINNVIADASTALTNKGLTFKGDSGNDIAKKLGENVTVKGGVTDTNNLTENNIGVVADGTQNLVIKLAKTLNNLTSVATETLTASTSVTTPKVILGTGDNAPTLTGVVGEDGTKAIDVAGAKITNIGKGTADNDAVNVGQLKELGITPDKAVVSYDNLDKTSITLGQKGADGENSAPVAINNVASGLGLDGKGADGNGSTSDPKAISPEKAKDAVAKLLETKGEALNKATNVGDLQAVAQAGLDFVGNDEKVVHRPLGTKLSITGEGVDKNASQTFNSASGNINVVNNVDNTLTIQLAKALTNISSIGGSEGQGKISFGEGAVNFNDNVIAGIKSAVSEPTEGKDYLDALANADDSSAVNVSDLKNATEALGNKLTDAGLSFAGDSGNNVTRKLSETLSIKGGVTDASKLTDDNIGVVADGSSSLNVKLSSELKGMTSFETAANADGTSTKLDANGIKVTGQDGKSAEYGLDGSTIANKEGSATYGANDVTFKDANNKELIKLDAANNAIVVNGKDGKDGITINGETKTITGLDQRTINGEDYGKGDNRGNAATEGAVKDLADAIGVGSTNTLPVDGATGAGGKDGLNGTSILDKVQALRDGTAGNAVYTTESGERLIKLEQDGKPVYYKASDVEKAADGSYVAKEGANAVPTDQIVISTVNPDGSTTEATKLANVASSIGGEVKSDSNSFIDNLNKVGATGDGSVNPNTAVTAQDLKNLADTGFKLQTNDNGVNTVKAGNTVQVKDGINTKVSKVEEKAGVFSYSINVNGVPMTYVNKEGKALAKVGDRFFLLKDNGELDLEGSTPENTKIAGVALVDPQGASEAQTLDNIKNGELKADSKQAVNGGQIANILGTDAEGKAITTNIGGTGKDNIDSAIKAVKTASVSEVTAGDNVEINTVESDSGKKVSISTSMNPNFDTVGLGAIRDQDGKLQPRISLGVTKDGALAVAGADGKSPVRITNVADPVQDSDAVNKRYVDMNNRKLRGGIAGAIATASLPQAYTSGKSLFAVSGGTYGGQSAVALGVSRISDNGKMIIKLVGSTNTQGSVSGGVGVGFEW